MTVQSVGPLPAALPAPLRTEHTFQRFDAADTEPREHGHLRRRMRFRSVGQRAGVQWLLQQSQFDAFWSWYEDTLTAGERAFDVRVGAQGESGQTRSTKTVWWVAQFAAPWQAEVLRAPSLLYRVSAELILYGTPTAVRVVPDLAASGSNTVSGSAQVPATTFAASGSNTVDGGAETDLFWAASAASFSVAATSTGVVAHHIGSSTASFSVSATSTGKVLVNGSGSASFAVSATSTGTVA